MSSNMAVSVLGAFVFQILNDLQNIGVDVGEFRKVASWVSHQVEKLRKNKKC